jgi:hypothetical protein
MSELTIKLIVILIPGVIATLIFGKLILHKEWDSFKFILFSTLFGLFSYLIVQMIIDLLNLCSFFNISDLTIWNDLTNAKNIPYKEVVLSSFISILLAFIVSLIENRKIINRIAKYFNISNKYGEENLFSRFLNSKEIEYIYLRDIKNNLTYHGWIKSFSETDIVSEIRIADVSVYNYNDSEFLYDIEEVYLSLNKQDIIIELAKKIETENNIDNGKKETK